MYSLKAILDKEPASIASAVRTVLFVAVLAGIVLLDEKLLAGVALALEAVLLLFVRNASTSKNYPTIEAGKTVKVAGTEDSVLIEASPPGPVGIEGGGA